MLARCVISRVLGGTNLSDRGSRPFVLALAQPFGEFSCQLQKHTRRRKEGILVGFASGDVRIFGQVEAPVPVSNTQRLWA